MSPSAGSTADRSTSELVLNGTRLLADASGALVWPERRTVIVADLHLEKGSSFSRHGTLLPPYDTAATLQRLAEALQHHGAERVVCLGDSFHDRGAAARLGDSDRKRLDALVARYDWLWITGNHDPAPPDRLGGSAADELTVGGLVFRHEARPADVVGEVSGHLHPAAIVRVPVGRVAGRCFVTDGRRLVMPAFGAYTGGLDVFEPAVAALFPDGFTAHVIGRGRIVSVPKSALLPLAQPRRLRW